MRSWAGNSGAETAASASDGGPLGKRRAATAPEGRRFRGLKAPANGKWKMEDGKWEMGNGKWKMEDGAAGVDRRGVDR